MVDLVKVTRRLRKLEEYVNILSEFQKISYQQFIENHTIYSTVERDLQLAIECVLDIGNHIIADKGYREPGSYSDIIIILGEEGVIPEAFAKRFSGIAGFRNILVHDYLDIDRQIVYSHLQKGLHDFITYIEYITNFIFPKN